MKLRNIFFIICVIALLWILYLIIQREKETERLEQLEISRTEQIEVMDCKYIGRKALIIYLKLDTVIDNADLWHIEDSLEKNCN